VHCLPTLFATSVLSAYTVRSHYAVSELPARLDICTLKCHPYYVRDIRTLTVLHPRYLLQSAGSLGKFVHLQLHPYWIRTQSANFDQIPYYLRTLYAKFSPYSIRSDTQRPCVGVKGALWLLLSKWQYLHDSSVHIVTVVQCRWCFCFFCFENKYTSNGSVLGSYFILRTKVRTQLKWCGNFNTVGCTGESKK